MDASSQTSIPGFTVLDEQTPLKSVLPRSISTTNLETTSRCRSVIQKDWKANAPHGGTNYFATTPGYTLTLPALNDYPTDFQKFVFDRIVAKGTQESLEREFCLNWYPGVTKLVPLYTMGDGNCLLHAASLAMWGFQDRNLVLRRAVAHAVNDEIGNNTLYQRWKHSREVENQQEYGLKLEPHQWDQEWQIMRQQTTATAVSGQTLASLDEFHVFVLANVLRRPIIMYAVPKLRSHQTDGTLQTINFHGVYLPLLWAPDSCKKNPLPLAYHLGHFSALVVFESAQQYQDGQLVLPLSDYYSQQFPVRFALPVEVPSTLLMDYLDLVHVPTRSSGSLLCAKMTISNEPSYLKPLISGFVHACYEAYTVQNKQNPSSKTVQPTSNVEQHRPACINDCGMYGDPATGLCSKCHQKAIGVAHAQEKAVFDKKGSQQPQGQSLVSGAIKCPRCLNPGHPSFLGMCEHCFRAKSTNLKASPVSSEMSVTQDVVQEKDPVYEVLPIYPPASQDSKLLSVQHPPTLPPPRNAGNKPVERSQCRTPGCEFFGTRELRFYCSKCFDTNMEMILGEVDNSSIPRLPSNGHSLSSGDGRNEEPTIVTVAPSVPGPNQVPFKCYKCREYFASGKYGGLCHGCFMKITKADSQNVLNQSVRAKTEPKYNLQPVVSIQKCAFVHCNNPATENRFCEYCNAVGPKPSACEQSQTQFSPIPKPCTKAASQSVTLTASEGNLLPAVSLSANELSKCFLCSGGIIGTSNYVCQDHARMMQKMQDICPKFVTYQEPTLPYEQPSSTKSLSFRQPLQSKPDSAQGDVPFGVPLSTGHNKTDTVLFTSHKIILDPPSASLARSETDQDKLLHSNDQFEAVQPYHQNRYAPENPSLLLTEGVATGETLAAGQNPPAKTLCATPGCSFKGYNRLHLLCPDCYQEKYDEPPPPGFPLV